MLDQISRRSSGLGAQGGHWKGQNIPKGSLESQLPAGQDSGIHVRKTECHCLDQCREKGRDTGCFGVGFKLRQKNVPGVEGVVNKNVAIPTKEVLIIVPLESMQELEVDSVQDVLFASGFGRVRNLPMF